MINETDIYDIEIIGGPAPESPSAAMRTQQWIRTSISHLSRAITEISPEVQHAATQLNVLPLVSYEENRWYGIREDGDIISFRIAHPYEEVLIDDLWTRNALLLSASDNFPELKVLILPAPLSCRPCARCDGAGYITVREQLPLCVCLGLGWLPPMNDAIEKEESAT